MDAARLSGKLHAGVSSEATIDGQDHAGNSGGELVVGQEQQTAQQLSGIHETAHGSTCKIQMVSMESSSCLMGILSIITSVPSIL